MRQFLWRGLLLGSLAPSVGIAQDEPRADGPYIDTDVQRLLGRESRDAAMASILRHGEYRGPGDYTENKADPIVHHVVVCPQQEGPPLFAVFLKSAGVKGRPHAAIGHLIVVASDGAIIRCYLANNVVSSPLTDANGDGVIDRVEAMRYGLGDGLSASELFILPLTEEVTPSLRVAFDPNEQRGTSTFRVVPATENAPARVELGPKDPKTGEITAVVAAWEWRKRAWVGPGGGPDRSFVRLPLLGSDEVEEFAQAHKRKAEPRRR